MKQKTIDEIKCVEYFIPSNYNGNGVYDESLVLDIFMHDGIMAIKSKNGLSPEKCFIDFSSKGIKIHKVTNVKRLFQLIEGNRWRGIHIFEMYEPGILEGTWTYSDLVEMPDYVVDYISKQIFQGADRELIMEMKG